MTPLLSNTNIFVGYIPTPKYKYPLESESESEYCLFTQKQKQKYITIHIKDFVNGGRHPKDMKCRYRGATRDRGTAFGDPSC